MSEIAADLGELAIVTSETSTARVVVDGGEDSIETVEQSVAVVAQDSVILLNEEVQRFALNVVTQPVAIRRVDSPISIVLADLRAQVAVAASTVTIEHSEVGPAGPPGPPGSSTDPGFEVEAATILAGHRVVTTDDDGRAIYADPSNPDIVHAVLWLTLQAAAADALVTVLAEGEVTDPALVFAPRARIYLGANGTLSTIPPTTGVIVRVAIAVSADTIFFDPSVPITLAA